MKVGGSWPHDTQNQSSASSTTPNLEPSSPRASGASQCDWHGLFAHNAARLCEVCSDNLSTVYCKSDRAYLCDHCDADIHLSNPLSGRHEVRPITNWLLEQVALNASTEANVHAGAFVEPPFVPTAIVTSTRGLGDARRGTFADSVPDLPVVELLPVGGHHVPLDSQGLEDIELESEWIETLDRNHKLDDKPLIQVAIPAERRQAEFDKCKLLSGQVTHLEDIASATVSTHGHGLSHGFQIPVTAVHIPQHPPTMLPFLHTIPPIVGREYPLTDPGQPLPVPNNMLDRKARVARYLQKKKRRTWANKIRYHSRKAYAENRPRIKGRFARPDEFEAYQKQQQASSESANPVP